MALYHDVSLGFQQRDSVSDPVVRSLTGGLFLNPHFQILKAIVETVAIFVVDVFRAAQFTTQVLFHDVAMFKDAAVPNL